MNQEYIAKNLCVEKDVENSSCKGCCQLKKRVAENKEQKKEAVPFLNKQDINFSPPVNITLVSFFKDLDEINLLHISSYTFVLDKSFFHPPEFVIRIV